MTAPQITAANFDETFNLDFANALVDGLSTVTEDSACVGRLVEWCASRGYEVSPDVCFDVLQSQLAFSVERGIE